MNRYVSVYDDMSAVYNFCFLLTVLTDESTDSPNSVSPRVTALPPTVKRMLSEGQKGLQSAGSPNKTSQDGESHS